MATPTTIEVPVNGAGSIEYVIPVVIGGDYQAPYLLHHPDFVAVQPETLTALVKEYLETAAMAQVGEGNFAEWLSEHKGYRYVLAGGDCFDVNEAILEIHGPDPSNGGQF